MIMAFDCMDLSIVSNSLVRSPLSPKKEDAVSAGGPLQLLFGSLTVSSLGAGPSFETASCLGNLGFK